MSQTYAEKLKDPRWRSFRNEYAEDLCRRKRWGMVRCECCDLEPPWWQIHHLKYVDGREPWEYPFDEVRLLCEQCHKDVHALEKDVRAFAIGLSVSAIYEFAGLVNLLKQFKSVAVACNVARQALYEHADILYAQEQAEKGVRTPP